MKILRAVKRCLGYQFFMSHPRCRALHYTGARWQSYEPAFGFLAFRDRSDAQTFVIRRCLDALIVESRGVRGS